MRRLPPLPVYEDLVALATEQGIDHLGVARAEVLTRARAALHARRDAGLAGGMEFTYRNPDRSTDPSQSVPGARSIIVAARSYLLDEPARPTGAHARVARYAWVDHYTALRNGLRVIANRLRAAGERAVVFCDDNGLVDREVAYLAGLGWFGKNANLLVPGGGSWFVLGSIVTTAEYAPAQQPVRDGCGSCRRCIDQCPTGAIVGAGVVDANRCLAWVLQRPGTIPESLRAAIGDRIYGCDDCQDACPPSVRISARRRRPQTAPSSPPGPVAAWVDVLDLLDADDDALLDRHGRWYLAGRDPRWLRRNALVVLGNIGDREDRRTMSVLARYRQADDVVLAEHAAWASERLGLTGAAVPPAAGGAA